MRWRVPEENKNDRSYDRLVVRKNGLGSVLQSYKGSMKTQQEIGKQLSKMGNEAKGTSKKPKGAQGRKNIHNVARR